MSGPVTNVDVEDVLASIRRLVSDGEYSRQQAAAAKRPRPVEPDSAPEPEPRPQPEGTANRFVLTPSLRIVEKTGDSAESSATPSAPLQLDEPVIENQAGDSEESTSSAEQSRPTPEDELVKKPTQVSEPPEVAQKPTPLEEKIAALEAAVEAQPDEWEPDGSEVASSEQTEWSDLEPRAINTSARARFVADAELAELVEEDGFDEDDEFDEDDGVVFRHVEPDPVMQEHLNDLSGGLDRADEFDDDLDAMMSEDNLIDEQMLRDLVADIVRQELQGVLGERITRNVRKLVRREIYRVLASQDFQ